MPRQLDLQLALAGLSLLFAVGCAKGSAAPPSPRFQVACDSADTEQQSTLFCVRTDTHNGDVTVLNLDKLPVTSGPSRAAEDADGSYQTVCDSTVTPQKSDFRCVRVHTRSGDVVLLRLSELPRWPR